MEDAGTGCRPEKKSGEEASLVYIPTIFLTILIHLLSSLFVLLL